MRIRRLRFVQRQYVMTEKVNNVAADVNNMIETVPRNVDNDY